MEEQNPFRSKPIVDVKNSLHSINKMLNEMKVDVICIKSEIKELKEIIKEKEKKSETISGGWWIY
tara:strand:- start:4144 stop:4338 length:195 start_codon:yes stop_codon:yes gene_type:complete